MEESPKLKEKAQRRKTGLIYDERMLGHCNDFNPNHPECPERIKHPWGRIKSSGILQKCVHLDTREATKEEIVLVHDEDHYEMMSISTSLPEEDLLALSGCYNSVYVNNHSFEAGKLAAGSVLELTQQIVEGKVDNGFALVRPPGHHAECAYAMGFSLFNSVAIAAKCAVEKLGLKRVLIVDWDIHHGNGTQNMFYNDKRILYVSLHRFDYGLFYPCRDEAGHNFTGGQDAQGYNVNVAWNRDKMGDPEYLSAFHHIIMPIAYEFNPELVLVSCGFDAAEGDPLGGYLVTPTGYAHMTHMLMSLAEGKLIFALEGGYNLSSISNSTMEIISTLLGEFPLSLPTATPPCASAVKSISDTGKAHSPHWKSMAVFVTVDSDDSSPPHLTPPTDSTQAEVGRGDSWYSLDELKKRLKSRSTKPDQDSEPSGACAPVITTKNSISANEIFSVMEEFKHTELFAVTPLPWCKHLSTDLKPLPPASIDASACCEICSVKQEPWVCLSCYHVYCGRYVNQHMLEHHEETGHCVVLSLADISVWCFNCDSYIDNKVLHPAKNSAHLSKFGAAIPGPS